MLDAKIFNEKKVFWISDCLLFQAYEFHLTGKSSPTFRPNINYLFTLEQQRNNKLRYIYRIAWTGLFSSCYFQQIFNNVHVYIHT